MAKITKFDKVSLDRGSDFSKALKAAMEKVAADYGLTVRDAGGSYKDTEFKAKYEFKVADPEAATADEKKEFSMFCSMFGLKPEHYGTKLHAKHEGQNLILVGFDLRRHKKYCIKTRTEVSGKPIGATENLIAHLQNKKG